MLLYSLKAPGTTVADDLDIFITSFYFFLIFKENKVWHFMWIVSKAMS